MKTFNPETQIATTVHDLDNGFTIQKTYDAEPFIEQAAEDRAQSQGQRWGEGRKVGTIPMAVLATFMREDGGGYDPKRAAEWLRANPAFVSFEPFLKVNFK